MFIALAAFFNHLIIIDTFIENEFFYFYLLFFIIMFSILSKLVNIKLKCEALTCDTALKCKQCIPPSPCPNPPANTGRDIERCVCVFWILLHVLQSPAHTLSNLPAPIAAQLCALLPICWRSFQGKYYFSLRFILP